MGLSGLAELVGGAQKNDQRIKMIENGHLQKVKWRMTRDRNAYGSVGKINQA